MWFDSLRIYTALSIRKSKDNSVFSGTPGYYYRHGEKVQNPIRHFFRKIEKQAWLQAVGPTLSFSSKHFLIRFFLIAQVCLFILLSESCLANCQIDGVLPPSITVDKQLFSVLSLPILKQADSVSRWIKLSEKQKLLCNETFYSTSVLLCLWYKPGLSNDLIWNSIHVQVWRQTIRLPDNSPPTTCPSIQYHPS